MGGTQLLGKFQTALHFIDHDPLAAAGNLCRHQRGQTDTAGTEHNQAGTSLWSQGIEHCSGACLDTAAQWRKYIQRQVCIDLDHITLAGQRVAGERRLAKETGKHRLGIVLVRASSIASLPAGHVQGAEAGAVRGIGGQTRRALATGRGGHDDVIAHCHFTHLAANLFHDTGPFMTE
ncbi:hypothetical protein D9M71_640800 [compost metagenome]